MCKKKLLSIVEKQKEFEGKARSAPCKLFFVSQSETLQEGKSYVNDQVKKKR